MSEQQDFRTRNESQFREIALRVLKQAGFTEYVPEKKLFQGSIPRGLMKKGDNIYCVETFYSRREVYTSRAILNAVENLIRNAKKWEYLPLIVVGGMIPQTLRGDILGKSIRTVMLDIENLLYIAQEDHTLFVELIAQLPYSPDSLGVKEPDFLPLPDWNAAYAGKNDWQYSAAAFRPDYGKTVGAYASPVQDIAGKDDGSQTQEGGRSGDEHSTGPDEEPVFDWEGFWEGGEIVRPEEKPVDSPLPHSTVTVDMGSSTEDFTQMNPNEEHIDPPYSFYGRPGTGKSSTAGYFSFLYLQNEAKKLKKDIETWKGGKQTNSAAYEKLCTRTLMRLFADDLTLWREQARSNSDLFRFDLICKIKRDNHKDFWEMAERYFNSKYIIFEFKNYSGKVTQKEVYTTVRYLYTKAMRGIAIIVSPNGMDENAGKAIRGILRDEGKLILSLTNEELVRMLQMKEDGEDPADFLSDKLDELLIDLEK